MRKNSNFNLEPPKKNQSFAKSPKLLLISFIFHDGKKFNSSRFSHMCCSSIREQHIIAQKCNKIPQTNDIYASLTHNQCEMKSISDCFLCAHACFCSRYSSPREKFHLSSSLTLDTTADQRGGRKKNRNCIFTN
jgi:hypothetical protein